MRDMGDSIKRGTDYLDKVLAGSAMRQRGPSGRAVALDRTTKSRPARSTEPARAKRRPPAYQVYASDDLASSDYYRLTLAERGLYDAMLRVQWVEGSVPSDYGELAIAIRRPESEVAEAMASGRVGARFMPAQGHPDRMLCASLDSQMMELLWRRERQADGGKETAGKLRRDHSAKHPGDHAGEHGGNHAAKQSGNRPGEHPANSAGQHPANHAGEHSAPE